MVGAAESTVSPSSSRTSRSTPWVLACWRPILTSNVRVRRSGSENAHPTSRSFPAGESILLHVRAELFLGELERLGRARRHPDLYGIVLPQRVAFPVLGHQQPARIRVTIEGDAEEVPHLTLQPVGRRPETAEGREASVRAMQLDLHTQPQPMRDGDEEVDELEAGLTRPEIDGREVGEKTETEIRAIAQHPRDDQQILTRYV